MSNTLSHEIVLHNKTLSLFAASLKNEDLPAWLLEEVIKSFEALAPFIKGSNQVLYIRDIPFLAIDGKYPGGHCYNAYEAMIAVPNWKTRKQQIVAAINHELHHMTRWQNPGYGTTLGGALLSEGIATYYEELSSGWTPPWAEVKVVKTAIEAALKEWGSLDYNHTDWFFKGAHGRWVGYGIGYQLAKKIFENDFSLEKSISITPDDAENLLAQMI